MAVVGGVQFLTGDETTHVLHQNVALEVRDRAGLGCRHVRSVPEREHVGARLGLQRVGVGGHEVERVTQARGTPHVGLTPVQRDHNGHIEGHLPLVVGDEPSSLTVDLTGVELGHQVDPALREHAPEPFRGNRLGERGIQRSHICDVHRIPHLAVGEEPVGEERELQRCNRTLDRHVDHVDH